MPFFGLMTVRAHDRIIARADAVIDAAAAHVADEEFSAARTLPLKVATAVGRLREARSNAFKNRQRYLVAEANAAELQAELATLRPDAEKHRERVRKATMNLKQNWAKVAPAVRLEAAEPPNDPYDTARDSRRDDREIHSL